MSSRAALATLTDRDLFQRIASFVPGVPWPIYEFWAHHKPEHESVGQGFRNSYRVVDAIVQHGTIELLGLAKQIEFPHLRSNVFGQSLCYKTELIKVSELAVTHHRADMFEWGISYEFLQGLWRTRPLLYEWEEVIMKFRDGDAALLDILKRDLPVETSSLKHLLSRCGIQSSVKRLELVQWLMTELPELHIETWVANHAAERGYSEIVQYVCDQLSSLRYDRAMFDTLNRKRNFELLAYLLEHDRIMVNFYTAREMLLSSDDATWQLIQRFAYRFQPTFKRMMHKLMDLHDLTRPAALVDSGVFDTDLTIPIEEPAAYGCLEVVRFLVERGFATATTTAIGAAARIGHVDVVRYLRKHLPQDSSTHGVVESEQ